ncbi:MAG: hypothetical protein AB1428_15135 [Bacteroidota bacterium]
MTSVPLPHPKRTTRFLETPILRIAFSSILLVCLLVPDRAGSQESLKRREITYENVTFSFDVSLAKDFVAETIKAVPLINKTEKPDGVWPEHIRITFRDSYVPAARQRAGREFDQARIYVFPTGDPANKEFASDFPTTVGAVEELNKYLSRRSHPRGERVPFLPWYDVSQAMVSKRKTVRFRNGRGVLFLTQFEQEKTPINNADLVYTFQGLTDDNNWYVSAFFPVTAPRFPPTGKINNPAEFARSYDRMLKDAVDRLERLPGRNFAPNLALLENIIRSLKVSPR